MIDASIIVTSYNVEAYLEVAVSSILNGTNEISFEIIIVDDGSADSSPEIAKSLANQHPNVRVIAWKQNTIGGVSTAANAGIDAAQGEFIGFLDGDDLVLPGTFDKLVDAARSTGSDLAICSFNSLVDESGVLTPPYDQDEWSKLASQPPVTGDELYNLLFVSPEPWRKIYRREFLGEGLRFPVVDNYFEDVPFHWAVIEMAKQAVICDFVGFHHRVRRPGQTILGDADRRAAALFHYVTLVKNEKILADGVARLALISWVIRGLGWTRGELSPEVAAKVVTMARDLLDRFSKKDIAAAATRRPPNDDGKWRDRRAFVALLYLNLGAERLFFRRLATTKAMNVEIWVAHLVSRIWR